MWALGAAPWAYRHLSACIDERAERDLVQRARDVEHRHVYEGLRVDLEGHFELLVSQLVPVGIGVGPRSDRLCGGSLTARTPSARLSTRAPGSSMTGRVLLTLLLVPTGLPSAVGSVARMLHPMNLLRLQSSCDGLIILHLLSHLRVGGGATRRPEHRVRDGRPMPAGSCLL